jgi:hypothetical protein
VSGSPDPDLGTERLIVAAETSLPDAAARAELSQRIAELRDQARAAVLSLCGPHRACAARHAGLSVTMPSFGI